MNESRGASSEAEAEIQYRLHHLDLAYPLHAEANGTFEPGNTELTETEFYRILDSLSIIHHLVESQKLKLSARTYNETFSFITDKINQNINRALEILNLNETSVGVPEYSYNGNHDFLEYGLLKEAMKLLVLLEYKYTQMLNILMKSEQA